MKTLFIDESGNTGTQRYSREWNFANQPYFLLCGVIVDNENIEPLNEWIRDLCSSYKIQGGELKFSKKTVKKNIGKIVMQLVEAQKEFDYDLFIEIVNKKFSIATVICNYCVFPYYEIRESCKNGRANFLKRCIANYIYESVSDELHGEFVTFFDSGQQNIPELQTLCTRLKEECKNDYIKKYIDETIDSFMNYDKLKLKLHNVFPLLDYYRGGISPFAVSPHISSFNNIIKRIMPIKDVKIIHDEISDLENALIKDLEYFGVKEPLSILEFERSNEILGLQLSDLWGGYIREVIEQFFSAEEEIPDTAWEILLTKADFVGPFSEQVKLFPYNLEMAKWRRDYKGFFG